MAKEQTSVKERTHTNLREPRKYKVILHNDNDTTMDFVVFVLMKIFHKSEEEASKVMLQVHHEGSAIAGIYPYDIAVTKVELATNFARENNFPLQLTYEPA